MGSTRGCGTFSGGGREVNELHLFGLPVTVNLDNRPGPDGFAIRIYATKGGRAKGVPIQSGAVEVWMFDGVISTDHLLTQPPTQTWKFTPRDLSRIEEYNTLGQCYRFGLRWTNAPAHVHVTVVARYLPTKGEPVYSSPSTITAAAK